MAEKTNPNSEQNKRARKKAVGGTVVTIQLVRLVVLVVTCSMATFILGVAYQKWHSPDATTNLVPQDSAFQIVSGTVANISPERIEVNDLRSRSVGFVITNDTRISLGGKSDITVEQVKRGDKVRIIPNQYNPAQARQVLVIRQD